MKINSKILSIPPYISTTWENVLSLRLDSVTGSLIVSLKTGSELSIPHLSGGMLEEVFNAHSEFIEHQNKGASLPTERGMSFSLTPGGIPMDPFRPVMQHDPMQKDSPNLPFEIIEKVANVAKVVGIDTNSFLLPESEPHCNCPYCQIAKAINGNIQKEEPPKEEIVLDTELQFREWDIKEIEKQLYEVKNPLDTSEHYQVFLGTPIGCTCGKSNCEHIRAVLNS